MAQNLITKLPGVTRDARNKMEVMDCWHAYFPLDVLGNIVKFTNQKLDQIRTSHRHPQDYFSTDLVITTFFTDEFWPQLGFIKNYIPVQCVKIDEMFDDF